MSRRLSVGYFTSGWGRDTLYHMTPTRYVASILERGLKPSTGVSTSGASGKKRVFLAVYSEDLRELLDEYRARGHGKEPFTMLEVRIPKGMAIYEDENTEGDEVFYYSTSTIGPDYIKEVGPIQGWMEGREVWYEGKKFGYELIKNPKRRES